MWQYNYSPSDGNDFLAHAGKKSYKGHKFIRKYRGPSATEYITQHFTDKNGQRDIVSRTKVTRITKASKSKKKNVNKKHKSSLTGFKKGSAKTKKAGTAAAKSIAKAVGKNSKSITNRYKNHEVHDDVSVYRSGKNEKSLVNKNY